MTLKYGLFAHFLSFLSSLVIKICIFATYCPVDVSVFPVADLIADVLVQGRGGVVRAGPSQSPASITCIAKWQSDRRLCPHCKAPFERRVWVFLLVSLKWDDFKDRFANEQTVKLTVLGQFQRLVWVFGAEVLSFRLEEVDSQIDADVEHFSFVPTPINLRFHCTLSCVGQTLVAAWT